MKARFTAAAVAAFAGGVISSSPTLAQVSQQANQRGSGDLPRDH